MNCPNCGSPVLGEQQFCRSCGAGLKAYEQRSDRRLLLGLTLAFGGIVVALFGRMLLHIDLVVLLGVLISISGMFTVAAYPLLQRALRPVRSESKVSQSNTVERADTTNKLPPISANDFVASVTENTTNLLSVPVVERDDTR